MSEIALKELNPQWLPIGEERRLGIRFDCPACPKNTAGGVHRIEVFWDCADPTMRNEWTLWDKVSGETFDDLTLSPSIDETPSGGQFHGWIKNGRVIW